MDEAARLSVECIREGRGDVLMKGTINTDNLLRAILNKEHGLLPQGNVMSHVAVAEIPGYDRMLIYSDSAVIPEPNLEQFDAILTHNTSLARRMGIEEPKVALVHFTEKVNKKFQCTLDYEELKSRAAAGRYGKIKIERTLLNHIDFGGKCNEKDNEPYSALRADGAGAALS